MANPWHHAISSSNKWGGLPEDYHEVHAWFDASKAHLADFRHRALRHHAEGIFECERWFGPTVTLSTCRFCGEQADHANHKRGLLSGADHVFLAKQVPTRWVGEQHVTEDLGRIPTLADWLRNIPPEGWMNRSRRLSVELEKEEVSA
jgi:hypothetical protein